MSSALPRFAEDRVELDSLLDRLPLLPCTHCGRCGNLIGHGFLQGYAERGSSQLIRGRRILCSNRGKKRGCGRTVSTLLSLFIERCSIAAATLWALFCGLAGGSSVARAAKETNFPQTLRSAYRRGAALKRRSLAWRSWLSVRTPTPASTSTRPLQQLRAHLTSALGARPFERPLFRQSSALV